MKTNDGIFLPSELTPKYLLQNSAKYITIWTLTAHLFVIVGIGHGIIPLCLVEVLTALKVFSNKVSLSDSEENSIFFLSLFSFLGQILLLASFFLKTEKITVTVKWLGLSLLWIGLLYPIFQGEIWMINWILSIPFIFASVKLHLTLSRLSTLKNS